MISVTLDEEMVEEFRIKVFALEDDEFATGVTIFSIEENWTYNEDDDRDDVFLRGPKGTYQYDEEFTEWLEIHRPEVFL